jgi:single-stranded-DNA-specific exonuclease
MGFCLGPRLNAAGRLEDMSVGIECLLATDLDRARRLAGELDALNRERREIEADMQVDALNLLDELQQTEDSLPAGICLYQPHWHQGVVGILASRVKERFHRPVIVFADAGDGEIKGSARSIPGLHIRDALDAIATARPDLLTRFGGHAMAAGLSLPAAAFERFSAVFDAHVRECMHGEAFVNVIETDGELGGEELTLDLAELLRDAGPWGQAFPEPLFDGVFRINGVRVLAQRHLKLAVTPVDGVRTVDAIAFNQAQDHALEAGDRVRLAYRLDVNAFRGNHTLQLIAEHIEAPEAD